MPLQKKKKPTNKGERAPRRSTIKSAAQSRKTTRPKVDRKGKGRRTTARAK